MWAIATARGAKRGHETSGRQHTVRASRTRSCHLLWPHGWQPSRAAALPPPPSPSEVLRSEERILERKACGDADARVAETRMRSWLWWWCSEHWVDEVR